MAFQWSSFVSDVQTFTNSVLNAVIPPNSNTSANNQNNNQQNDHQTQSVNSNNNDIGMNDISNVTPPKPKKRDSQILTDILSGAIKENQFLRMMDPKSRNANKILNKLSNYLNISYPEYNNLTNINNKIMNENIKYSMKCAFIAYQPAIVAFKSANPLFTFKSQKQLICKCLHIESKDIIIDECSLHSNHFKSNTHQPAFYLIIDHQKQNIVLSIRGTSSISDIMTDLNASSKKCNLFGVNGCVHEGMFESAKYIYNKSNNKLMQIAKLYSNYEIIITGHSLGAGVASLLGLMYKDDKIIRNNNRLKVYSFASPLIVSKDFIDNNCGNDYITSIALSNDIVTRLSWETVKKHNLRIDLIMQTPDHIINKALQLVQSTNDDNDNNNADDDDSDVNMFLDILKTCDSPNPDQQLYPLGKILWFVPKTIIKTDNDNNNIDDGDNMDFNDDTSDNDDMSDMDISDDDNNNGNTIGDVSDVYDVCDDNKNNDFFKNDNINDKDKDNNIQKREFQKEGKEFMINASKQRQQIDLNKRNKQREQSLQNKHKAFINNNNNNNNDIILNDDQLNGINQNDKQINDKAVKNKSFSDLFNATCKNTLNGMSSGMKDFQNEMKGMFVPDDEYDNYLNNNNNNNNNKSMPDLLNDAWSNISKGFKDIQNGIRDVGKSTRLAKYGGDNYILCDATKNKHIFQDLCAEFPECMQAHEPQRYLWAMNGSLR